MSNKQIKELIMRAKMTGLPRWRLAEESGLSKKWVDTFMQGKRTNPQLNSIIKFESAIRKIERNFKK